MLFKKKIMNDIYLTMINNFSVKDKWKEFHKLLLNHQLIIILRLNQFKNLVINFLRILINYHFLLKVKQISFSRNLAHQKALVDL